MFKKLALLLLLAAPVLKAQTAALPVYDCTQHGTQALTSGLKSTNFQQGIVPSCQVTIYLTGTTTIATTSPQSPFTANSNGSLPPVYAAKGQGYDVVFSGGIPPNTYPIPVTLTDVQVGGGGGGGLPTGCTSPGTGDITCSGTIAANLLNATGYVGTPIGTSSVLADPYSLTGNVPTGFFSSFTAFGDSITQGTAANQYRGK